MFGQSARIPAVRASRRLVHTGVQGVYGGYCVVLLHGPMLQAHRQGARCRYQQ